MKTFSQYIFEKIINSFVDELNGLADAVMASTNQDMFDKNTNELIKFFDRPYTQKYIFMRFNPDNQKETGFELEKNRLLINIGDIKDQVTEFINTNTNWTNRSNTNGTKRANGDKCANYTCSNTNTRTNSRG